MKTSTKEKIEIMQAYEDGQSIEFFDDTSDDWVEIDPKNDCEPLWAWDVNEYRLKPKPVKLIFNVDISNNKVTLYDSVEAAQAFGQEGYDYVAVECELGGSSVVHGKLGSGKRKALQIVQCPDSLRWYSDMVGKRVAYIGDTGDEYKSVEPSGFINFVQYDDAIIVEE